MGVRYAVVDGVSSLGAVSRTEAHPLRLARMHPSPLLACPIMADLVARHRPPVIVPEQPFPALVDAIVSQQISGKAAASILARLRELVPIRPTTLATADLRRLRRAGLSRAKATYVRELARFAVNGGLRSLHKLPDEAVVERLVQVKGIGVWTAEMFLIFCLNRPDVFPVADLGVRVALRNWLGLGELPRPGLCRELTDPWRPHRTVASWYLWRTLDTPGAGNGTTTV